MKSKRHLKARAQRASGFRPRLEVLEHRCCPCSNNLLDDGTLLILGDEAAETIAIRDDGFERGVTVQCDGGEAQTFTGVRRIVLRSAGGDDRVHHLIGNPNETPADIQFDLGKDNDILTIEWINPNEETPPRAVERPVVFDVNMGTGNDLVSANFVNPPDGDLVFRTDLGAGDNGFILCWQDPTHYRQPQAARRLRFDILGANDRDDVTAMFMTPRYAELDFRADLAAAADNLDLTFIPTDQFNPGGEVGRFPATFKGQGGGGTDRLNVFLGGPDTEPEPRFLNGDVLVSLDGGPGDDVEIVEYRCLVIAGALSANVTTGGGDDSSSVSIQDSQIVGNALIDSTTGQGDDRGGVVVQHSHFGSLNVRMDTGGGNDSGNVMIADEECLDADVSVQILTGSGTDTAAMTLRDSHDFTGTMNVLLDTGGDDDRASLLVERCFHFGPLVNFRLNTGAGNDSSSVMISDSDGSVDQTQRRLNVEILTGAGVDNVFAAVSFNPQPDPPGEPLREYSLLIDAGADSDTVDARIDLAGRQDIRLRAAVLGADGDDRLGLSIVGIGNPNEFEALVDGGAGYDIARVSRNVLVRNVEEVFLIE